MHQRTGASGEGSGQDGTGAARCPVGGDRLPGPRGRHEAPLEGPRPRYGAPVPTEVAPGVHGWLLLGYKENLQALRDQDHFSADPRPWNPSGRPPAHTGALPRDGEEHRRLRTPVVDALAGVGTPRLVPIVERVASHLLGRAAAEGRIDLIGQFAAPLPALVLNEVFGLPDDYGRLLADLAHRLWNGGPEAVEAAESAVRSYFTGLVARKRARPGEDLTSRLLAHPHGLTDEEAAEALSRMWESGHELTTHLIGNALLKLLIDPPVWTAYVGGTLTPEDFIDVVMWTDCPVRTIAGRYTATDVSFAGTRIRRGAPLLLSFDSAHTDPSVAPRDGFAMAGNRSHLAWGAGAHRCPATGFTRELVRTAVDAVVDRLRGMVLDTEEPAWRDSPTVHGLEALPVRFAPTGERVEPERDEPPAPRRRFRRKRRPAPQGARYQAPLARKEPAQETAQAAAVRRGKTRAAAPAGVGARYQAPFAAPEEESDLLERLLEDWRPR
ncbi:cytochrome P450 [Nocardiopsis sp. CNT312]|uniref:cytochrome P450 n=1 Tax=Nocardiopsis sp. CNT312 TaxID=1137268 RepID=UPI00048C5C12|nr:cytochrome P450 [Nocardiopsis sp. CNT312]